MTAWISQAMRRTIRLSGRRRAGPLKPISRAIFRSSVGEMSRLPWKDGRAAAIRVSVLAMGPALAGFDEAEPFKQRRDLAGLENWQRARHYAT